MSDGAGAEVEVSSEGGSDATYETDVTARKPRSEDARGLTTVLVGEAWDYMEQVHMHMCVICAY